MERSAADLEKLWRDGRTLESALEAFTKPRRQKRRKAAVPSFPPASEVPDLSRAELADKTISAVQFALSEMGRASAPIIARREELVRLLISGELIAVGFLKGDLEHYRQVPPGLLDLIHFNWAKSWVGNAQTRFEKVRVAPSTSFHLVDQDHLRAPPASAPDETASPPSAGLSSDAERPARKRGPKPLDPFIESAIESLRDDRAFIASSQTDQIRTIVARVQQQNPLRFTVGGTKPSFAKVWRYLDSHPLPKRG